MMTDILFSMFLFLLFIAWSSIFFDNVVLSKYFVDENGRFIFYPDDTKKGYVATQEQMAECAKSFKKCFFFNVKGYRKDIERIFANSDVVNIALPRKIFQKNLAHRVSWILLISFVIIDFAAMFWAWKYKLLFLIAFIPFIPTTQLLYYKLTDKN